MRTLAPAPLLLLACTGGSVRKIAVEPSDATCVVEQEPIAPTLPWSDVDALCADPNRGQPWNQVLPPADPAGNDAYALQLQTFVRDGLYKQQPYSWLHDADWRLTGPYEGCTCPPGSPSDCKAGSSRGPHPAVRIYYSPEIIDWLCTWRRTSTQAPDAADIPDGAMIIKEMLSPDKVKLAREPGTDRLWIAPPDGQGADWYDSNFTSWTIMVKAANGAADGWYWAGLERSSTGNPPIQDRCAFTTTPYPGSDGPVTAPPGCEWYPTYWQYTVNDAQYPNYQFGNYCTYCHASAVGEQTFASLTNVLGQEIRYEWTPPKVSAPAAQTSSAAASSPNSCPNNPFPRPNAQADPTFAATFPQLDPSYEAVWATRLPSHTWDHQASLLGTAGAVPDHSQFLTSDQCESCHEGGGSGQLDLPYMVVEDGETQIDLSPWAEWSVSPMGLAGRDPIFHSQLELERNIASGQRGLSPIKDCIDNTCLHCHGAPGARQYNIDTKGQGPGGDPCKDFLPPADQRAATDYDGKLFTQDRVLAWRDEDGAFAAYGGLARDGINCTICHHISDEDLDDQNLPKTFTGNFRTGPPDRVYGPFPNDASKEEVLTKPMDHALGVIPEHGAQTQGSQLCGTCHVVYLPVFDQQGALAGTAYEQTTYLEWLLSDFGGEGGKSCQDCHMPGSYGGSALSTGIANVQGTRYPEADYLLPASDVDNPTRPYNRHQLYGLNAFLNSFVAQFPLLVGVRQQDYMNPYVAAPLLTGLEGVLQIARTQTATVTLGALGWQGDTLQVPVTVQNIAGHTLPSGVGFRRLFIEVLVLDDKGTALWASGRTNAAGAILDGITDNPLPTESFRGGAGGLPFQPHYQTITSGAQVQIYEELTQDAGEAFTTSFLHRYWLIKDNRLRPRGWNPARVAPQGHAEEYGKATEPGHGPEQHWWPEPSKHTTYKNPSFPAMNGYTDTKGDADYTLSSDAGLSGADSLVYAIALPGAARSAARSVRVTLYSQSAPPSFLAERFDAAAKPGAEARAATQLYYIAGHLNTAATASDGAPYLEGWRLRVGEAASAALP